MMYLLKGISIGLLFGVPVGAVGTLTLQRTITNNKISGLITGLGSSTADVIYALIGVFGITFISSFLLEFQIAINILGSIFILYLGFKTFHKKMVLKEESKINYLKQYLSSFLIGITNPTAILSFIFAFSYMNVESSANATSRILVVLGVLLGTLIWWSVLVVLGTYLKKKMNDKLVQKVNKVFGLILIVFGTVILLNTFF